MPKRMALCAIWALFGLSPAIAGQTAAVARPAEAHGPAAPRPALWKIADADTTIYLFGTTHALPKGFRWQSPAIRQVIRTADELVVESLDDAQGQKRTDAAVDDSLNPVVENSPILLRVSPDKRAALERAILQTDFPVQFYDAMPTWMASLVLAVEDMAKDGSARSAGVEAALLAKFRKSGRPILAVEDGAVTLRKLHGLSAAAQTKMLEDTLDDIAGSAKNQPAQGDLAWARGETGALDAAFTRAKLGDELYNLLILGRNQAWTRWLAARLERPGVVLFAVGAGHFAGPDSLQTMLTAKGITVSRAD